MIYIYVINSLVTEDGNSAKTLNMMVDDQL